MDKISERMFDQLWRLHDLNDENPKFMICGEAADQIKALSDHVEKLETENQWIPVSERLPEKETPVLIACKNKAVFVSEYKGTDYELRKIWSVRGPLGTGRRVASSRVTHWHPLPEPPKGE